MARQADLIFAQAWTMPQHKFDKLFRASPANGYSGLMLSYDDALELLLETIATLPADIVQIDKASGRYLAKPVFAAVDAPRADVSVMDGYAVRMHDVVQGASLIVTGESAAGLPYDNRLAAGQAVRISTGAHVPDGADCIIMQEYAQQKDNRVSFSPGFGPGRHIRKRAGDFALGDTLLEQGQRLTPGAMIALAGADVAEVEVVRQPRVAIIATGSELAEPGSAHQSPHSLPESGSYGVAALAKACGAVLAGQVQERDDLDALARVARDAVARADCVVVIGGASVGDHDLARPMFGPTGLREIFSKVAIKPGKPVWFGMAHGTPVLGLPGNPTSALVTARLFLMPLLAGLQGGDGFATVRCQPQILTGELAENGSRETFVRARSSSRGLVPARNQESGAQSPLASSDWLIRRSAGAGKLGEGSVIPAIPF